MSIASWMRVTVFSCAGTTPLTSMNASPPPSLVRSALPWTIGAAPSTRGTVSIFRTSASGSVMPPTLCT